jgi:hypothetical protein
MDVEITEKTKVCLLLLTGFRECNKNGHDTCFVHSDEAPNLIGIGGWHGGLQKSHKIKQFLPFLFNFITI